MRYSGIAILLGEEPEESPPRASANHDAERIAESSLERLGRVKLLRQISPSAVSGGDMRYASPREWCASAACITHDKAGLAAVITAMITDADKAPRFSTHHKACRYHALYTYVEASNIGNAEVEGMRHAPDDNNR